MNKMTSAAIVVAGVALSSLSTATAAHAAPDCEAASFAFTQCSGSYELKGGQNDVTDGGSSNLATQILNDQDVFGEADWSFGNKDDGSLADNGNSDGFTVSGLGSTSGTFGFSNLDLATTDLAVSLKSAKGYSLYYFEAGTISDASQIAWDTLGTSTNKKNKAQALSHISYYTRITAPESGLKKVPEPAVMSGLIAIGMAGALRRRKRVAA